ncbi:hypothetical protein D3C72_1310370 [compost metagenome]
MQHQGHDRVSARIEDDVRALQLDHAGRRAIGRKLGLQQLRQAPATVTAHHLVMGKRQGLDTPFERCHIVLQGLAFRGRMGNQCTNQRQDVLDPVVELFVEHALAHLSFGAFTGEQFAVVQYHFDDSGTDGIAKLAVLLGPG